MTIRASQPGDFNYNAATDETQTFPVLASPSLAITLFSNEVIFTWSSFATGFVLESTTLPSPSNWSTAPPDPVMVGGQNVVTNPVTEPARFYRLRKP